MAIADEIWDRLGIERTTITTIGNAALASHRNWTAAAWLLERKYPNEYAQATRDTDEPQEAAFRIVLTGRGAGAAAAPPGRGHQASRGRMQGVSTARGGPPRGEGTVFA